MVAKAGGAGLCAAATATATATAGHSDLPRWIGDPGDGDLPGATTTAATASTTVTG